MSLILQVLAFIATVFVVALGIRIVIDIVQSFARAWRPRGVVVVLVESVYSVTQPVLGVVRRVIKPLDLGGFRLDLAFIVVFIVAVIVKQLLTAVALSY
ncbi:YggT family protein [Micrococcales bacterium 31B]|nr:YggT family protein [Micrococcales bacterium 31B]